MWHFFAVNIFIFGVVGANCRLLRTVH
jgi:hypothetical protein